MFGLMAEAAFVGTNQMIPMLQRLLALSEYKNSPGKLTGFLDHGDTVTSEDFETTELMEKRDAERSVV